jgi:hypothetical protein
MQKMSIYLIAITFSPLYLALSPIKMAHSSYFSWFIPQLYFTLFVKDTMKKLLSEELRFKS